MKTHLYLMEFLSGKVYVGITTETPWKRFLGHRKSAMGRMSGLPVHKAVRKYGEPRIRTLCVGPQTIIAKLEVEAIKYFNCQVPNGYNVSPGGEVSPSQSPEFKAMMSSHLNPMKRPEVRAARSGPGHHSKRPEQRERARLFQLARNAMSSPEAREKSSKSHAGNRHSEETKKKMSKAQKGKRRPCNLTPDQLAERGRAISAGHARRRAAKLNGEAK